MLVRVKREKTAKRGNSRWNINGGHKSKRTIVLFPRFGILFLLRQCLLFFLPRRSVSLASLCRFRCSLDETFATMRPFTYKCPLAMDILASPSQHQYRRSSLFSASFHRFRHLLFEHLPRFAHKSFSN